MKDSPMFNLFDVTRDHEPYLGPRGHKKRNDKPRQPNAREIKAYLCWVAERRGVYVPADADFLANGIWKGGECLLEMPGYGQEQSVTLETLDDAGEVLASQALPVEPKKGGVIWSAADVRKAHGPIAKPGKVKAAKRAPIAVQMGQPEECPAIVAPVGAERIADAIPAHVAPEDIDSLSGPEIAPDGLADLMERVEALEARVATLSAQSDATPIGEVQPRRTPAHERAIRRAWAERCQARARADLDRRALEAANGAYRGAVDALAKANAERDAARADAESWKASSNGLWRDVERITGKRIANTQRARRMIDAQRQRARMAQAALSKVKRDMADPSQPERASDIARLMQERDKARTACTALEQRAQRSERAVEDLAGKFEAMAVRVAQAEAAVRRAA